MSLTTTDANTDPADLKASGADVDAEVLHIGDYVPPMFTFRDAERTTVRVLERPG